MGYNSRGSRYIDVLVGNRGSTLCRIGVGAQCKCWKKSAARREVDQWVGVGVAESSSGGGTADSPLHHARF